MEGTTMKFGTVINCIDGRVQYPGDRSFQEKQIDEALDYLQRAFGDDKTYVGLYVNEQWEVEECIKLMPVGESLF